MARLFQPTLPLSTAPAEAIRALNKRVAQYFTLQPQGPGAEALLQGIKPASVPPVIGARLVEARLESAALAACPANGIDTGSASWRNSQCNALCRAGL